MIFNTLFLVENKSTLKKIQFKEELSLILPMFQIKHMKKHNEELRESFKIVPLNFTKSIGLFSELTVLLTTGNILKHCLKAALKM